MKKTLTVLTAILFLGCGGGGGGGSEELKTASATYVDSPVSGVEYECGSVKGVTNEVGGFIYEVGKDCKFKVGDIAFKTIKSYELENGKIILENSSVVASLLQTLDIDGDPANGITITEEIREKLKGYKVTALDDETIQSVYEKVKDANGYDGKYFSKTEALMNLIASQTQLFKSLVASKTLYAVSSDEEGVEELKVEVDPEASSITYESGYSLGMNISGNLVTFENNSTALATLYKNRITLTYLVENMPVYSDEVFFSEADAKDYEKRLSNGEYLKSLIAGKVFYQLFMSDGKLILNRVTINKDATAGMFSAVDGSKFGGTFSIKIDKNRLKLHIDGVDVDYSAVYLGKNDNMLILAPSKSEVNVASYMFFDESYAKNLLESLLN